MTVKEIINKLKEKRDTDKIEFSAIKKEIDSNKLEFKPFIEKSMKGCELEGKLNVYDFIIPLLEMVNDKKEN